MALTTAVAWSSVAGVGLAEEVIISDRPVATAPTAFSAEPLELPEEVTDEAVVEKSVVTSAPEAFMPRELDPKNDVHGFDAGWARSNDSCCDKDCSVECEDGPGLIQVLRHRNKACWTARVDALLLWRNAPPDRTIISSWDPATQKVGDPVIGASDLESTMGSGPRISLFRTDCHGHTAEFTYFQAFNFLAQEATAPSVGGYALAPGGVYGNRWTDLDAATVDLTSGIKSFEANGRKSITDNISLLGGFRWVEWRESVSILDRFDDGGLADDLFGTSTMNSLYGGQIGFDARLWDRGWLRIDSVMKGGAYYNVAVQQSSYRVRPLGGPSDLIGRTYDQSGPAAFVGELGFMGTIPITNHFEFTFGYLGLWLESIAQPTGQLGKQTIVEDTPSRGRIDTTGGTVLQGVTLGFNARW